MTYRSFGTLRHFFIISKVRLSFFLAQPYNLLVSGDILFYVGTAFASLKFIHLARCWKEFMGHWVIAQEIMKDLETVSVRTKINIITIWLAVSSICKCAIQFINNLCLSNQ